MNVLKQTSQWVLGSLQSSLLVRFLLLLGDPILQPNQTTSFALPFYSAWRPVINMAYQSSAWLVSPMQQVLTPLANITGLKQTGFPFTPTASLAGLITPLTDPLVKASPQLSFLSQPPSQWLPGVIDWSAILTLVGLQLGFWLLASSLQGLNQVFWAVVTEMSYTDKKQRIFRDTLEKRSHELTNLNVQYRSLAKEASKLAETIMKDELTQVYNKRFFFQKITELFTQSMQKRQIFSVLMLDIDFFKKVNDTHGHIVGDEVLVAVAKTIEMHLLKGAFCCRFGGEEFAVLVPLTHLHSIKQMSEAIREAVMRLRFSSTPSLRPTISIGVAYIDFASQEGRELKTYEDMLKLADDKLYEAKLNGRNQVQVACLPETLSQTTPVETEPTMSLATVGSDLPELELTQYSPLASEKLAQASPALHEESDKNKATLATTTPDSDLNPDLKPLIIPMAPVVPEHLRPVRAGLPATAMSKTAPLKPAVVKINKASLASDASEAEAALPEPVSDQEADSAQPSSEEITASSGLSAALNDALNEAMNQTLNETLETVYSPFTSGKPAGPKSNSLQTDDTSWDDLLEPYSPVTNTHITAKPTQKTTDLAVDLGADAAFWESVDKQQPHKA